MPFRRSILLFMLAALTPILGGCMQAIEASAAVCPPQPHPYHDWRLFLSNGMKSADAKNALLKNDWYIIQATQGEIIARQDSDTASIWVSENTIITVTIGASDDVTLIRETKGLTGL